MSWTTIKHVRVGGERAALASRSDLLTAAIRDCQMAQAGQGAGRARVVVDVNGQGLSMREKDPEYLKAMEEADIVHADGGSVVLASKLFANEPVPERSCTTDMLQDFANVASNDMLTFYLLGSTEEVNSECANILRAQFPNLKIVGRRNGYFTADEEESVINDISAVRPDILWVGLGKPKEQIFSVKNARSIQATWIITCGGCFNYVAGNYKRAPKLLIDLNLEWLHRMLTNPQKLLKRYLTTTPHAAWLLLTKRS